MKKIQLGGAALVVCLAVTGALAHAAAAQEVAPAESSVVTTSITGLVAGTDLVLTDGVALSGTLNGGQLNEDGLMVGIKAGDWRDLPEGSSFDLYQVPAGRVQVDGSHWKVLLNPTDVPAEFVAADGQVDFVIEGHGTGGETVFHTVSARRVTQVEGAQTGWLRGGAVLPDGWVVLPGLPATSVPDAGTTAPAPTRGGDAGTDELEANEAAATTQPEAVSEIVGIPLTLLEDPTNTPNDDGGADATYLLATPPQTRVSAKTAPWNCGEISGYRYNLETTIATGYPVDGDKSSLTYDSNMYTTSGSATSFGGSWRESGTETTQDGWGADFRYDIPEAARKRSYRTWITYGYYACYNAAGYYSYWVFPIKQPGAAKYYFLSSAPNWTRCVPAYHGVIWRRSQRSGNDYELSYGVKARDYIGIELYSAHGYSAGHELRYHVANGHKRVCGNNNTPGQAGKVQERYY